MSMRLFVLWVVLPAPRAASQTSPVAVKHLCFSTGKSLPGAVQAEEREQDVSSQPWDQSR